MFIHTFSMKKFFSYQEAEKLWKYYKMIKIQDAIEIIAFNDYGLRILLYYRSVEEIKYDKYHKNICAEIIITPYKLIHTCTSYGKLCSINEYANALTHLEKIFCNIKKSTGILLSDAEICRIDLTYDIITPSQTYTKEIIATLKAISLPYGYQVNVLTEEAMRDKMWKEENAFLYTNHSQEIAVKLYDKEQNLLDLSQNTGFLQSKGLLRFEISLNKRYLKKNNFLNEINIAHILDNVLKNAYEIYLKYIIEPLDFGDMLSMDILLRYLHREIESKEKLLARMEYCISTAHISKKERRPLPENFMGSEKRTRNIIKHFRDMDICPIPLIPECPYIPSISQMIGHEYNSKLLKYAKKHTKRKEYWDYEE